MVTAGKDWEVLRVNDMEEECYATPAIVDGDIYMCERVGICTGFNGKEVSIPCVPQFEWQAVRIPDSNS